MTTKEAMEYIKEHDKEFTQYRLAKTLGINSSIVSNWVLGKTRMADKYYKNFKNIYPTIEISDIKTSEYKLGDLQ